MVKYKEIILVFSDEIEKAKEYLKNIRGNLVYMEGNKNYEDLYLMTLCHDFICSISTLSWWGAWLINYPNKIVVTPKELIRPGHWMRNDDLCCKGWVSLRTCRYLFDDYRFIKAKRRTFRENLLSLKRFLKNKCIAN
jgi:hypothetical protein